MPLRDRPGPATELVGEVLAGTPLDQGRACKLAAQSDSAAAFPGHALGGLAVLARGIVGTVVSNDETEPEAAGLGGKQFHV